MIGRLAVVLSVCSAALFAQSQVSVSLRVLLVENFYGPTRIEAWDGSTVQVAAGPALFQHPDAETLQITMPQGDGRPMELVVQVPATMRVSVRGGDHAVTVEGTFAGLSVETASGDILLRLRPDAHLDVSARSLRGEVHSELPVPRFGPEGSGALSGRLGRGGTPVIARTLEGAVRLLPLMPRPVQAAEQAAPASADVIPVLTAGSGGERPGAAARTASPQADAAAKVFHVEVSLVNLNVKVSDRSGGRMIPDLKREDFLVYEDDVQQQLTHFEPTAAPINLVLLLDFSGSTDSKRKVIKNAAKRFIDTLGPQDQVAVCAFTRRFMVVSRFTQDRKLLRDRIDDLKTGSSGTAFYDALWATLDLLDELEGARKAVVIMTDGVDNYLSNPDRYETRHDFPELLARAAEEDATLYPVYLDTEYEVVVKQGSDTHQTYATAFKQLESLADQTGGLLFRADRVEDLNGVYEQVAAELRTLYSLAYTSSNSSPDGQFRRIKVLVKDHPDAVARTRRGYHAR